MKNESHPLIQAMSQKKSSPSFNLEEPPRHVELKHSEIPGLPGKKVGEHISVNLEGHIHSQHADGHTIMEISHVKPDSNEMVEKENPGEKTPKTNIVTTQDSHAG